MVTVSSYTPISVNLTELKSFCRVDGSADDALLTMLFSAAVEEFNSYTGYRLGSTTVTVDTEGAAQYALPLGPVTAITSVTAYDDEGVSTALTLYDDYDYINTVISAGRNAGPYGNRLYLRRHKPARRREARAVPTR
jgi:uncharacterized phiE125 gp8 family phage protein